jgi:hypothetical protein
LLVVVESLFHQALAADARSIRLDVYPRFRR